MASPVEAGACVAVEAGACVAVEVPSMDGDGLLPRISTAVEIEEERRVKRAELMAKRKREDAERAAAKAARTAKQIEEEATSARERAAAQQQQRAAVDERNGENLKLRFHPTAGKTIMSMLNKGLMVGGMAIDLDGDQCDMIRSSARQALSGLDEFYAHSTLVSWLSSYIIASFIFPAEHLYILFTLINACVVMCSWRAWNSPSKWFGADNSILQRIVFPIRELMHPDDRDKQSQVFQALLVTYLGMVNWLMVAMLDRSDRLGMDTATSVASVVPLQSTWWLLQAACITATTLGRFEAVFAYAGVAGALATGGLLCGLGSFSLPLVLAGFSAWRVYHAHTTTTSSPTWWKLCLEGVISKARPLSLTVLPWAAIGWLCTSAWPLATWHSFGAHISIQWSLVWTVILFILQHLFSQDYASLRLFGHSDNLIWSHALGWALGALLFVPVLYLQYAPLLIIHMALVLKLVAIPHMVEQFTGVPRPSGRGDLGRQMVEAATFATAAAAAPAVTVPSVVETVVAPAPAPAPVADAAPEAVVADLPDMPDMNDIMGVAMQMFGNMQGGAAKGKKGNRGGMPAGIDPQMVMNMMPAALQMLKNIQAPSAGTSAARKNKGGKAPKINANELD